MREQKLLVKRIECLCKEQGISYYMLAYRSTVPLPTLMHILDFTTRNPGIFTLAKICNGLGITLKDFFDSAEFKDIEYELEYYDRFDILKMQHTGEVKVDGVASTESLLFNARQHLDECNYDKALSLYKQVIEITPKSHVAWWGCYCCEKGIASYYHYRDKYGNSGAGVKANILTELILKYGKKAIDYAPEEYSEAYRKALEPDIQFIDEVAGN